MKTIVVSDLHLTDKFEPRKFRFLQKLFSSCDKLIINGDLWCGFSTTFDGFINSDWKNLFPLMLAKHTVYIHGNHDNQEFLDFRVNLFCREVKSNIDLSTAGTTFHILHGHEFFKLTNKKNLNLRKIIKRQKFYKIYFQFLYKFLFKTIGAKRLSKFFGYLNKKIIKKTKQFFINNQIVVSGHTHLPAFQPEKGYINTGFILSGLAWYLEIDDYSFRLLSAKY